MLFVHLSSAISLFATPFAVIGLPAEAVRLACVMLVMLYEATVGVFKSVANVTPTVASLQTVAV